VHKSANSRHTVTIRAEQGAATDNTWEKFGNISMG